MTIRIMIYPNKLYTLTRTVMRVRNEYSHNPNRATLLPNTKFIFPKLIFIVLCGLYLPMRTKARVLALISFLPKLLGMCTEHMTSKREYSTGRCQIFCCHLIWVRPPSPPQLIQPQWLPLSFSFTHRADTRLPLLAS